MKKKYKLTLLTLIVWIITISLCLIWFNWKLLIVLILFGWAMNLEKRDMMKNQ